MMKSDEPFRGILVSFETAINIRLKGLHFYTFVLLLPLCFILQLTLVAKIGFIRFLQEIVFSEF
jgi:hypothetical protein